MRTRRIAAVLALSVAGMGLPMVASGAITTMSGEVHSGAPPASVALNQHQHSDTGSGQGAHAFNEEQDHTTTAPITLDICIPGNPSFALCEANARAGKYDRPSDFVTRGGTISPGTCIDSHVIHADPTGTGRTVYDGQVRFASVILGVIVSQPRLIASDADPGLAPTTTYEPAPTRGLEFGPTGQLDTVSIEAGATRLDFHLDVNQPAGDLIDQVRVITIGDPASCPGQATQLTLTPKLAANPVNTQHCVIASVKNATGGPAAGVIVRFDVEGASEQDQSPPDEDASRTTDQNGQAMHCYQGPEMVGADTIHAYADNDRDNVQDADRRAVRRRHEDVAAGRREHPHARAEGRPEHRQRAALRLRDRQGRVPEPGAGRQGPVRRHRHRAEAARRQDGRCRHRGVLLHEHEGGRGRDRRARRRVEPGDPGHRRAGRRGRKGMDARRAGHRHAPPEARREQGQRAALRRCDRP